MSNKRDIANKLLQIFREACASPQQPDPDFKSISLTTGFSKSRLYTLSSRPPSEKTVLKYVVDYLDSDKAEILKTARFDSLAIELEEFVSAHGGHRPQRSRLNTELSSNFRNQVDTILSSKENVAKVSDQLEELTKSIENAPAEFAFRNGTFLLQRLCVCHLDSKLINGFQYRVETAIKAATTTLLNNDQHESDFIKQLTEDAISPKNRPNRDVIAPREERIDCRYITPEWVKEQRLLWGRMVPGRSRLAKLEWPSPYLKNWAFDGSERFRQVYGGGKEFLDVDSYLSFASDPDSPIPGETPGVPRHSFFRPNGFLFDCSHEANRILQTRGCFTEEKGLYDSISPRLFGIAPRLIATLVLERRLVYNSIVAASDVAPTHQNENVTIRPQNFSHALLGSVAIGIDAYREEGSWEFDGIQPVAEDGRWMLLRSNHASKAVKIAILCVTKDSKLCFRLQEPHLMFDTPSWSPTLVGYAIPRDFISESKLCNGVINAVERIVGRYIPATKVSTSVAGFALDAGAGLQPHFFVLCRIPFTEYELRSKWPNVPLRFHPLVDDNPAISLSEAYSLGRYSECDLLRASLFASWRWFVDMSESNSGQKRVPAKVNAIGKALEASGRNNANFTNAGFAGVEMGSNPRTPTDVQNR